MSSKAKVFSLVPGIAAALLAAASLLPAAPAHAGDLSGAALGCYIDTYAWDVPAPGYCSTGWTPWNGAGNPGQAYFEVSGLTAGNYSYTWTNLSTGLPLGCTSNACSGTVGLNQSIAYAVQIRDNDTGATTTVTAYAEFYDAWI